MDNMEMKIKLGDILGEVSESKKEIIEEFMKSLMSSGARFKISLEDTEIYFGDYKLSCSGKVDLKTELKKEK